MANLIGCVDVAPRNCDDCPIEESNKIVHFALVRKGTVINRSTPALYASSLLSAALACNAIIIRNVSGEYDGGAPTFGTGPGKAIDRPLGGTHTMTAIDFGYVGNEDFWNGIKKAGKNYEMHFFTDTRGWYVNKPLSISPKPAITADNQTLIEAQIIIKWSSIDNPVSALADVDEFESCQVLFDFDELDGFINESNSLATIDGSTINVDSGDTLNAYVDTNITLSDSEVKEGTLPAGITVSVSGDKIYLQGSSVATGSYPVTLRASNACGVSGEFEITIVVA